MPSQTYTGPQGPRTKECSDLDYGELGMIINGHYAGAIIAKMYNGYVCVYDTKKQTTPFAAQWGPEADLGEVRVLGPDECIILSNKEEVVARECVGVLENY